MIIRNLKEANKILLQYVPLVSALTGKDFTLERIRPFMAQIGDPQQQLKVVHLAGTSGKTSTAYYMAALLRQSGKKVGLAVSPHIRDVRERVQVNGNVLPEKEFCRELGIFMDLVQESAQPLSYFEILYAFAPWLFHRQRVEYAVIETGMGGLHDATNIATRRDKICILTDIGFDHMNILGDTLEKIAAQKIGIAHPGNTVLMYEQANEVMQVVRSHVEAHDCKLYTTTEEARHQLIQNLQDDLPNYQKRNWLLAEWAYEYIARRDALPGLTPAALTASQEVSVPARMEIVQVDGKQVILDGAHNLQKMEAFIPSFRAKYPNTKPVILLALKEGKDHAAILPLLAGIGGKIITTTFNTTQDLPVTSLPAEMLAAELQALGAPRVQAIPNQVEAWQAFQSANQEIGIVTGSFYLISQLRSNAALWSD